MTIRIAIIGDTYNVEDQLGETEAHIANGCIIPCYGFEFHDEGGATIYKCGDAFNGGIIIDCFVHPESDCTWCVVKCNDVYFEVEFIYDGAYTVLYEPPPSTSKKKKIKDSTMLNGGKLW